MISQLIKTKSFLLVLGLWLTAHLSHGQSVAEVTLDSCYAWARQSYPLIGQYRLLEQSEAYSLQNAATGYRPQISLTGQASYQSEVTKVPISIPNQDIPTLSKKQYKLFADINQPLTDLLTVKLQQDLVKANSAIERQQLEVSLYQINERVNQLYFGILLLEAQISQTQLLEKDLQAGISQLEAAYQNGTALKSSTDQLKAELLNVRQKATEITANRQGYIHMLAAFTQQPLSESTRFNRPLFREGNTEVNRPELALYRLQRNRFTVQEDLLSASVRPKISLFAQTGYGRPALNMLSNEFEFYYLGGLRLNWNLSSLYTFKREKDKMSLQRQMVATQEETFLFNTQLSLTQNNSEVAKYQRLLSSDQEIIALRESIKTRAKSQLENGTITPNDYVSFVTAEDNARQNLLLHQIQLLKAQFDQHYLTGNSLR